MYIIKYNDFMNMMILTTIYFLLSLIYHFVIKIMYFIRNMTMLGRLSKRKSSGLNVTFEIQVNSI